jgi:hypothetical protein
MSEILQTGITAGTTPIYRTYTNIHWQINGVSVAGTFAFLQSTY